MSYGLLSKYRSELMGAAMLWVMLFHAFDLDLGVSVLNDVRAAGFGGVDIFIVLSAMGLTVSLGRKEQSYGAFLARRGERILPAYFAVMLPYTLFQILYYGAPWSSLVFNAALLSYWVHCSGAFNWYVSGIMLFYALTPPCLRFLRGRKHRERAVAVGIVLSLGVCQLLMREGYWQYVDVFYRVPLFFLGLLLGLYLVEDKPFGKRDAIFWTLWLLIGVGYGVVVTKNSAAQSGIYTPLCHLFLFTTVPLCLLAGWLFEKLPLGLLRRALRFVGERSLEIYLLNVSLFAEIALLRRIVSFGPSNRLYFLIMFAVNIALGALGHRLLASVKTNFHNKRRTT